MKNSNIKFLALCFSMFFFFCSTTNAQDDPITIKGISIGINWGVRSYAGPCVDAPGGFCEAGIPPFEIDFGRDRHAGPSAKLNNNETITQAYLSAENNLVLTTSLDQLERPFFNSMKSNNSITFKVPCILPPPVVEKLGATKSGALEIPTGVYDISRDEKNISITIPLPGNTVKEMDTEDRRCSQVGGPQCLNADETGTYVAAATAPYNWVASPGLLILGSNSSSIVNVYRESYNGTETLCLYSGMRCVECIDIPSCTEVYCEDDPGDPVSCEASLELNVCTAMDENGNFPHPKWRLSVVIPFGATIVGDVVWSGTNIHIINDSADDYLIFEPTSEGGLTVCATGSYSLNGQICNFDVCENYYTWDSQCSSSKLEQTPEGKANIGIRMDSDAKILFAYNNANTEDETVHMMISNLSGQVLFNQSVTYNAEVNLNFLNTGIYVLQISDNTGGLKTEKIFVR